MSAFFFVSWIHAEPLFLQPWLLCSYAHRTSTGAANETVCLISTDQVILFTWLWSASSMVKALWWAFTWIPRSSHLMPSFIFLFLRTFCPSSFNLSPFRPLTNQPSHWLKRRGRPLSTSLYGFHKVGDQVHHLRVSPYCCHSESPLSGIENSEVHFWFASTYQAYPFVNKALLSLSSVSWTI